MTQHTPNFPPDIAAAIAEINAAHDAFEVNGRALLHILSNHGLPDYGDIRAVPYARSGVKYRVTQAKLLFNPPARISVRCYGPRLRKDGSDSHNITEELLMCSDIERIISQHDAQTENGDAAS